MNPISHSRLQSTVSDLDSRLPSGLDLTQASDLESVRQASDQLYQTNASTQELKEAEAWLVENKNAHPLILHLALKNALSRRHLAELGRPLFLSVVFAVYKEHERIRTQAEHKYGEDFLVRKVAQLDWLLAGFSDMDYELIVVDDGCPEGSGRIAREIAEQKGLTERVQVLFLKDAIEKGLSVTRPLSSPDESRKGGSIEYGLWHAVQSERNNHVVLFTDADLSTHLGQCGLLVEPILMKGRSAAIGSRRETTSVVVKQGVRNTRGKLFIYLWKRLLKELNYITDTQCGFKAFSAKNIRAIIEGLLEKQFAFDIELLLKTELRTPRSIEKIGVAWIDSEAASTTTDLQPYLPMLRAIVKMYRHYLPRNPKAEPFAEFIETLSEEKWARLVERVPAEIADRNPAEFDVFDKVQVSDLQKQI